tara:strand:+ start:1133 stop:1660 length:528 start_codon:yes stop_codon:yes gene_type:complete
VLLLRFLDQLIHASLVLLFDHLLLFAFYSTFLNLAINLLLDLFFDDDVVGFDSFNELHFFLVCFLQWNLRCFLAAFADFLVLGHVPFGNKFLLAEFTLKRLNTGVFSHVNLEIRSCVIFLVTAWKVAVELIDVVVGRHMILHDPLLSELLFAPREFANYFDVFGNGISVCGHMII